MCMSKLIIKINCNFLFSLTRIYRIKQYQKEALKLVYQLQTKREGMFPIHLQIEITADYVDSDIEDALSSRQVPRRDRKKAPPEIREYLEEKVPGRGKQINLVSSYIESLRNGDKSPLCLHGSTGCGKTSIVMQLMNYMKNYDSEFRVMYMNCMNFTNSKKIYSQILQNVFEKRDKKPEQILSTLFSSPLQLDQDNQFTKILLIFDEIDQYFSNKSFIYNLLDWIQTSQFPFGVIMISNMVDFSSNVQAKLKSRLKFNSIIFAPYTYENLIQIVKHKYKNYSQKFDDQAIVYLCKKVAGINSDVRLIERYYNDAVNKHKDNQSKIMIEDIRFLFVPQAKEVWSVVKPYQFLLQIFWRSPRRKNISIDIQHYCLGNGLKIYKQNDVLYLLYELEQMGLIQLVNTRKPCDLYYNSWGINLKDYVFILEGSKNNN